MKVVVCTCAFNFVHDGHWEHIEESNKLGDKLIVIVANDESLRLQKGGHNYHLEDRIKIAERPLKWLNPLNEVVVSIDNDGTIAETLRMIRPQIFAKGGDRVATNMPQKELDVCKDIGCDIVYGVGRTLNSSSRIKKYILADE
jgi:D-beta-D-heptose 7-phosphate kinase/D-beta-D-heptose 1-phosphate adenosyltransferase